MERVEDQYSLLLPASGSVAAHPQSSINAAENSGKQEDGRNPRRRIFLWALFISLICGLVEAGEPLEDMMRAVRDSIRAQPAPNDIVVMGIDDKTVAEFGSIAVPRSIQGKALDNLFAMGAKRVFVDRAMSDPTTASEDAAFTAALSRHRGKVYLGTMRPKNMRTGGYTEVTPLPQFLKVSEVATLNGNTSPFSLTARLPYESTMGGQRVRSVAAILAGKDVRSDDYFRPDWSIRLNSIPTISFADVVGNRIGASAVNGKDVLVGPTAYSADDIHRIVLQGWHPGVYFHVVGAQTLRRGIPENWGWVPVFVAGIGLALLNLSGGRRRILATFPLALGTFIAIPLLLDSRLVTLDIFPGLLLYVIVAWRSMTLRRVQLSRDTNPVSGLPNIAVLRQSRTPSKATLVALKIRNHAAIAASFDDVVERAVIEEICRRAMLEDNGGTIFHSEDILVWHSDLPLGRELADHLEGINSILGQALQIGARKIDVSVAFGVDADTDRPMASRVGSAILCAEEAAHSNDIWKFYDSGRRTDAAWQLSLLSRLDQGIDKGEVWVAYQPQLDLKTRTISGAEALVRWTHPVRGNVGPDEFIAAAEAHNRIGRLTAFVLDRAVAHAARLNAAGVDFSISVNLSVQLLESPELPEMVRQTLVAHHLPPHRLVLEITETGRLERNGASLEMLHTLSAMGVRIAIDDYGTGNATLEYLKILPSDEIKIDRSLIKELDSGGDDQVLVASTIAMAHSTGRTVVAEGVETPQILELLTRLGCDSAQGFLIGHPVDGDTLAHMIRKPVARRA